MKEHWTEYALKADFAGWGRALGVSPLIARILRNRGIESEEEAEAFLHGSLGMLTDPETCPEFVKAADLLESALRNGTRIVISSDFDADGVFGGQILFEGLQNLGGTAEIMTPDRLREGYGLNRRIVDDAVLKGAGLLLTCDNGIAAINAVAYAKEQGLTVVVTDHHEVQFEDTPEGRKYLMPAADAVVDPKCPDSSYPFRSLCGAGVAFRLIQMLYRRFGLPEERAEELLEYAAIATVADVVELKGENRILVREGLARLRNTENVALSALIDALGIDRATLNEHTISFRIAPCFNTTGRISDIREAFDLLGERSRKKAGERAERMVALNEQRKAMTEEGVRKAEEAIREGGLLKDRVLVVVLPDVHQSLAGIIAGRIKEKHYRPVFVLTKDEEPGLLKGSGRSIESYHMLEALMGIKELLLRGGGHKMAAGVTIREDQAEAFRKALNDRCTLTEEDLTPTVQIDARAPLSYWTFDLVNELKVLEPFGVGNPGPLFARAEFEIQRLKVFEEKNVTRVTMKEQETVRDGVYFGDPEDVLGPIREHYGEEAVNLLKKGLPCNVVMAFTYVPKIHEYRGEISIEIVCRNCCRVAQKVV